MKIQAPLRSTPMIRDLENVKWNAFDRGEYREASFYDSIIETIEEAELIDTGNHPLQIELNQLEDKLAASEDELYAAKLECKRLEELVDELDERIERLSKSDPQPDTQ